MTDKEKKDRIADILMEFLEEYNSNVVNRPMIPSIYAGEILESMQEEPVTQVWHDASKKPKEGSWICVCYAGRDLSTFLYQDGKIHNNYVDTEMIGCKWAYQEDLIKL